MIVNVKVQDNNFDVSEELDRLQSGNGSVGAVVNFTGLVRDHYKGKEITAMELEHYPGMTESALQDIAKQAIARWQLQGVSIIHRIGYLKACDPIVFVAVASAHRAEAFQACAFIMDFLKTDAPFWKKEHSPEGAHWVDARETDQQARHKWLAD